MTEEPVPEGTAGIPRRLAPAEAEAIVAVRGLLDEALSRVADSTVVGRRVAAVLMDGAAEAAMATGLARFNESPTERDKFDDLRRRLTEHLRAAGRLNPTEGFDGWADVRRLRLVRNNAQHHQIAPDHQTLVAWSAGVRRFVGHVIAAAFEVELITVSAASAIEHDELRVRFVEAEEARAQGDTRAAVNLLRRVFGDAQRLWDQQRRAAIGLSSPGHDELGLSDAITRATRHLEDTLTTAPFALDLGEYFWWQRLLRDADDERVVITAADAARAVTFVFTWVVRWESFSARYLSRERVPGEPPEDPPPSRRPDGAAELDPDREPDVEVRFGRRQFYGPPVEEWVFRVPYRNAPPEDVDRHRDHYLDQELWSQQPPPPWEGRVWRHGGDIDLPVDPADFDADVVLDELGQRFERAHRRQEEDAVRATAAQAERQRLESAVAAVAHDVLAIRHDGQPPFSELTLEAREPQPFVLMRFTNEFANRLRAEVIEPRPSGDSFPDMPSPARMRYDGIEFPFDHIDELHELAAGSLAALDDERRRTRDDRTEVIALGKTLDAAGKEAMRRRTAPPTSDA